MADFVKATEDAKAKAEAEEVVADIVDKKEEDDEENPEKHESTAVFVPVVKLEEVETLSGEEDEDILFSK